jgi:hypothetical protein
LQGSLTTPELPGPGAIINYYFRTAPAQPVTLEIVNRAGEVVRTLGTPLGTVSTTGRVNIPAGGAGAGRGVPPPPGGPPDQAGMREPPAQGRGRGRGGAPAAVFTANAGMQRYVWNMESDEGLLVPPGTYILRLTSGAWKQEQPLEIRIDPRLAADRITAADLELQYQFNRRLRAATTDARRFTMAIESAVAAGGPNREALERIRRALVDAPGAYPRPMLNRQLSEIGRVSNAADARPNNGAVQRLDELEKELAALKAEATKLGVK